MLATLGFAVEGYAPDATRVCSDHDRRYVTLRAASSDLGGRGSVSRPPGGLSADVGNAQRVSDSPVEPWSIMGSPGEPGTVRPGTRSGTKATPTASGGLVSAFD